MGNTELTVLLTFGICGTIFVGYFWRRIFGAGGRNRPRW
jgi:hypothetical protein